MLELERIAPRPAETPPGSTRIVVPAFPEGPGPIGTPLPVTETTWSEMLRAQVSLDLLRELAADEARYQAAAGDGWKERAWLLTGQVMRAPGRDLYVTVDAAVEAVGLTATALGFAFGPDTWERIRPEILGGTRRLVGWLHTHHARMLERAGETTAPGMGLTTSLFISRMDYDNALAFFAAGFMTTAVMAGEAVVSEQWARSMSVAEAAAVFGFWGESNFGLARRSVMLA